MIRFLRRLLFGCPHDSTRIERRDLVIAGQKVEAVMHLVCNWCEHASPVLDRDADAHEAAKARATRPAPVITREPRSQAELVIVAGRKVA